jgi:transposase
VKLESDSTWGTSKTFRPWKIEEPLFLPPTVQDFVGPEHLARLVLSLVLEAIDLTEITGTYGSERGQPPFSPTMMTALLLYAYCSGVYSSRRIAKACRERVDFMSIVGLDVPDFRTISDFRKRHRKALGGLFTQVLHLCEKAGLVKLGHVALDGTKIKANASKHKAMSYGRMEARATELEAEVAGWLRTAEAADAEEDKLYGPDKTGEEMPKWVSDKQRRIEKIRQAKAELEAEAKAAAEAKRQEQDEAAKEPEATERCKGKRTAAPPSDVPDAKAQKNFTDPESRIMKSKDGFVQARHSANSYRSIGKGLSRGRSSSSRSCRRVLFRRRIGFCSLRCCSISLIAVLTSARLWKTRLRRRPMSQRSTMSTAPSTLALSRGRFGRVGRIAVP